MKVCSLYFHKGEPSYEMMESHPDWKPSVRLGHNETKETNSVRFARQQARDQMRKNAEETERKLAEERAQKEAEGRVQKKAEERAQKLTEEGSQLEESALMEGDESAQGDALEENQDEAEVMPGTTDNECDFCKLRQSEINRLMEENRNLREELEQRTFTEKFLKEDVMVKYYTGLPSFLTFTVLLTHIETFLPQGNRKILSPFQHLLITFMRLRLDLPIQHIAHLFRVDRKTVSAAFCETICVLHARLSPLVYWPDRDSLRASMPHQFVETFGKRVAVIVDCFEIFMERPSNLKARAQTFSNYKHRHTQKYMIGITPQGAICFLSKGWGGRASDKHITENCGFLDKLLPGDMVLADRGFDISESVGMMCAEVKIPAFTRGRAQMDAKDIESTRELAHLRIHVERVIGNVRNKYTVIAGTVPISMVLPCEGEDATFLDKVVTACCALTNMCPSVV